MDKALSNPVILQEIFQRIISSGFQELTDVKDLRLVCKCWDQALLSLAKPKLTLKLNPKSQRRRGGSIKHSVFKQFCANMTPKLARSIQIEHKGEDRSIPGNMQHFSKTFSPILQDISIVGAANSTLLLVQILEKYVPNLRKLTIVLYQFWEEKVESKSRKSYSIPTQIPAKTRLKEIQLLRTQGGFTSDRIRSASLMRQLQVIINASLNLAHLYVYDIKCPELSKCPQLVSLCFALNSLNPFEEGTEALESLCLALSQAQDSLQRLELKNEGLKVQSNSLFKLPPMSKLKILRNASPKTFPMGNGMRDIGAHRMKSLEILELTLTEEEMEKFLWKTLSSLHILGLKYVHLVGPCETFPIQVSHFINCLSNFSNSFHGLETAQYRHCSLKPYIPVEGASNYQQILYSIKRLRSLVFVECKIGDWATDYVKANSLPIHFNPGSNYSQISEALEQARQTILNDCFI